jgi:regulator of RNase E activity RraA
MEMPDYSSDLKRYTPCDVADACLKLNIAQGYLPFATQRSAKGESMVGRAYTVLYASEQDGRPALKNHYIDSAPTGSVVVLATPPELQLDSPPYTIFSNALYGGLMSTRAKYLGCAGTVVLGNIRDIDEHRKLNYPVFSYGIGIAAPTKRAKVVSLNSPLTVKPGLADSPVTVHPGDYIIGDENGVTVLPGSHVVDVLRYMELRTRADELVAQDIQNGIPAAEAQANRRKGL